MQGLFDFLKKYSYWLLFILLEGGSLLLLFRFNLYQGSVWFTSANTVSGRVLEWESDFLSYIALGERNKDLMRKNLVLEQRVRVPRNLVYGGWSGSSSEQKTRVRRRTLFLHNK